MGLRVLEWRTKPGISFPVPLLADDRAALPPAIVKQVQAWLATVRPRHEKAHKPTAQMIGVPGIASRLAFGAVQATGSRRAPDFIENGRVRGEPIRPAAGIAAVNFQSGTAEIVMSDSGRPAASFHLLMARDPISGSVILAEDPLLWVERLGVPVGSVPLIETATLQ